MNKETLISSAELTIRRMSDTEVDYRVMTKWLTNPQLLEHYEGRDKQYNLEEVKKKYRPRVLGIEPVHSCIILYKEQPIGYIQFYELNQKQREEYKLVKNGRFYGIDMFIGETNYWNQGLGNLILKLLAGYLFEKEKVDLITIDPGLDNQRAIKSYEKAGFQKVRILKNHQLHEGVRHDCWLMIISRSNWLQT